MVGWHLLLLLVVEIAVYGAVGRHLHLARGWSTPGAIAVAVGIYVGVRIVLIAIEFLLARWKGSTIPEALHVPPSRLLTMYWRELGGWLLLFTVVLPFKLSRRSVLDRSANAPADRPPLLLVHGLGCNRGNWFWFRRQLEARGYCVHTLDCTPPLIRVAGYAPQVARAIDEILGATGARQVVLIGHSMGGLVSRAYIDQFGADKVAHVITLGTPHAGTWMARLGLGAGVRNMDIQSGWLAGLREREAARSTPGSATPYANYTCVFTYHDNLVTPQISAILPGAGQVALSGIGHVSLVLSNTVLGHVLHVLERLPTTRDASNAPPARRQGGAEAQK